MGISVIIPVFNCENYIEEAVLSALSQTQVREIIIIDDGSKDKTVDMCELLIIKDNRVKLFFHEGKINKGRSASRNLGIKNSSMPYLAFLDADDIYLPNRFLSAEKCFYQNENIDGVYEDIGTKFENSDVEIKYKKLGFLNVTALRKGVLSEHLFDTLILNKDGYFSIIGFVVKKSAIKEDFDEKIFEKEDTDWILRNSLNCKFIHSNNEEIVALRRVHNDNSIFDLSKKSSSAKLFYKKWFNLVLKEEFSKNVNKHIFKNYIASQIKDPPNKLSLYYNTLIQCLIKPSILNKIF